MITFLDHNDVEYGAEASISITNGVNGERSISGTIHNGDAVINNLDKGWRLRFEDEYYSIIFAEPVDLGRDKEAKFDAVHQFFYDFDKSNVYGELNGSSTFINYLNFIFNGSGYSYSLEIDVKAIEKENFGYKSRLSLFYDIINSAGVEFVVHGRVVRILARVGTDLSSIVKKGFNLNEIRLEKNIGSFVTFKKGFGAFIDDENPSLGRLEVEYESPLAQIYGRREAEPLVDERWSVEENLYERLKADVDNSYSISVQIDMEDLTKAGYDYEQPHAGDYIMAINDDLDLKERIRIVSFQSDYDVIGTLISHKVTCNSIGNVKKQTNDYTIIDEKINDAISRTEEKFLGIVSANGRNRNYYGSEFPIDEPKGTLIVGDQLWLKIGEVTKRYYWNGEEWVVDPFSENQEWLNEEIDRIQSQADQLGKNIEASDQKANQALADAGLAKSASESAEAIAQQAQAEAESAKSSSSEALDKAILAGTDAETAKQNALDAVSQVSEAKQSASEALGKAGEAVTKANEAISQSGSAKTQAEQALEEAGFAKEDARTASANAQQAISNANEAKDKADAIPETINQTITERGLTTGTQVERLIDDATGEMRLAIADVSGQIPNYIMGVTWDKSENPKLIRTDYLQDYAELEDFELLSADYNVTKTGVSAELSSLNTKKLDTGQFTDFKTNEFDVTVAGFSGRISDVENKKLDDDVFESFRTNDYDVTVDGFRTNIESLQTEKLDDTEFESFKSNDYSVTVDGIKSSLTHIEGIIPDFVVGVVWDKSSNPKMKRTDYTEEMVNLEDFESLSADYSQTVEGFSAEITAIKRDKLDNNAFESFKTNEFNVTVDGIDTKISSLETNKLDDIEFESFKTNVFDITVDGLDGRIESVETNKLDDTEFESFKINDYQVTVDGLSGYISRVETDKLDSTEFTSFKTNDYDVTVSGFRTALTDKLDEETFNTFKTNVFDVTVEGINGSIESLQTEKLDSTDFNTFKSNEYEVTVDGLRMDLTSVSGSMPTVIMGVRWDKSENPKLYRTDDTGGVDDYEYSQQTSQFISDISGLSGRVTSVETNKLGTSEFNSFKTNTYAVDLAGLRTNISSLDEGKLGSDEFSTFKTNVFDVSVSGLSGRIGTVETEKLDSETYDNFKTNTYDVDVSGLRSRMSSVESKKLDSGTFETFRDTTYSNTIEGITGSISTLQEDKLDNNDFNSFKQNEYELTVDGLKMSLTEVTGTSPTIVLGVEWDKSSDSTLERTDFSVGYASSDEFESLQAEYNFTKESWSTRLSQIENAGYATQSWSNNTFATPQSVTTQLQAYARTTDLNGMVTETTLATKNYITAGAVSTLLASYAKTGDVPTATQFNSLKNRYDSMEQTIGTTNDSVARAVMTSSLWETEVTNVIQSELAETTKNETAYVEVTSRSGLENLLMGGAYSTNIVLDPIRTGEVLLVYVDVEPSALGTGNGTMQVEYGGVTSSPVTIYKSLGRSEYSMVLTIPADNSRTGLFRFSYNFDSIYSWGNIRGVRVEKATTIQVPAGTGAISSKITQLYDQISMALTGADGQIAHLIANASGVSIKGEIIHLDGKVKMDEGFARKFMVEEMTADTVNAFSATFANAIVGNLDVNNIAGNKASFIQMLLNGVNTSLRVTSDVVDIMRNDGTISTRLTQNGMEIWRDGAKVGDFESRSSISQSGAFRNKKSVSITPERDSYISLGYYQAGQTTSTRVLSIAGDTGMLYLSSPIYPSESSTYGLNIQRFTLNGGGGIRVGSTGGSSGIFFGDSGHVSIQFNGTWYSTDRLIN